ncbi:hypothetical protein AN697_23215 [Enterobacter cloacae subsp. cloacae]|uniref:hypothetical protein n=1 Tax=Enterobacter cloacae TaxID=550 RepID=UPI0006DB7BE3|nr:hypothetical protein [Enterobacter cloacae]KPU02364.1 hypothetical protein AN697_23215 [Enterobacter cloacae subsp. cloacae]
MVKLPVITAFGGYGPAGRSSSHHTFRRMVIESLSEEERQQTLLSLAILMGLLKYDEGGYCDISGKRFTPDQAAATIKNEALEGSLIRKITDDYFDVDAIVSHAKLNMASDENGFSFNISSRQLPQPLPQGWHAEELTDQRVRITVRGDMDCRIETLLRTEVQAAGLLPQGFRPGDYYNGFVE